MRDWQGQPVVEGGEREGRTRLIGCELRIRDRRTGQQEEVAMWPLDLQIPDSSEGYGQAAFEFNVTLHTSKGDVTIGGGPIP